MDDMQLGKAVSAAVAMMEALGGPAPMGKYLAAAAEAAGGGPSSADLWSHVAEAPLDDRTAQVLHRALSAWDHEPSPQWANGTQPNSEARRTLVYELLEVPKRSQPVLDKRMPPYLPAVGMLKIAKSAEEWYTEEREQQPAFYWPAYLSYLEKVAGWHPDNLAALRRSTKAVVESLSDPTRDDAYQSKGLVMGFVQSGKTANFTGVIARAADAGYRLVIVLAGTLNILRAQTQRRLDKELVGKNAIVDAWSTDRLHEYSSDAEWTSFVEHDEGQPSFYRWERLTTSEDDYHPLGAHIAALQYHRAGDPASPLFTPANLHRQPARLLVVKKQVSVLRNLVRDLHRLGPLCSEIPALIIDDESDQASLNTHKPTKDEQRRRTAINARIVDLLQVLPRAQYVGYTATPFANVFVDMDAEEDLFPRDFILSLATSRGYMGPSDFHDLDPSPGAPSNKRARVRDITTDDDAADEHLPKALDAFVLSGALKLFRAERGEMVSTKHHTMLVHTSARKADHEEIAALVSHLYAHAGYVTGAARPRLERLFVEDFRRYAAERPSGSMPETLDEIWDCVGEAIARIDRSGGPVRVVNGDNEEDTPDFDGESVWKILVGGTKLSRGYTVEGLTVSYYRRRTAAKDTLTQMGRWFGYRNGYEDLVRLFVGRAEASASRSYDLYEAFEAACIDELEFRRTLRRYEKLEDGSRLTPRQVPPLVTNSLPWLTPTSKNKMWNAVIASRNFGASWVERVLAPAKESDIAHNRRKTADLIRTARIDERSLHVGEGAPFSAFVGSVSPDAFASYLAGFRWSVPNLLELELGFIARPRSENRIGRWLLLLPQLSKEGRMGSWEDVRPPLHVVERSRIGEEGGDRRFKAFSDPVHREVAEFLAGGGSRSAAASDDVLSLLRPDTAVALVYPVRESASAPISIGLALRFPPNELGFDISFTNRGKGDAEAVVVPVN